MAFQPVGFPNDPDLEPAALLEHPVIHAIEVRSLPATQGRSVILTADNEGVTIVGEGMVTDGASFTLTTRQLVPGAQGERPKRGCSEIHLGRLGKDRCFLATIEPWHGSEVVVWSETEPGSLKFGSRTVLDSTLADGHALWVADVDGDGDDEIFAGHRGKDHRVSMYDLDREERQVDPHRARPRHRRPGPARRRPRRRRHARRRRRRRRHAQRRVVPVSPPLKSCLLGVR